MTGESTGRVFSRETTNLRNADAVIRIDPERPLPTPNPCPASPQVCSYVDPEFPDRSALVFAPQQQPTDDSLLQVREIRNLRLNANLVTLSACNTGVGPVGEEGVANIVNAFIEAGSQSVVSTLWELEDHATTHLMTVFYEHKKLDHRNSVLE
jgi:hypothetical protein